MGQGGEVRGHQSGLTPATPQIFHKVSLHERRQRDDRFGSFASFPPWLGHVRFTPNNDRCADSSYCQLGSAIRRMGWGDHLKFYQPTRHLRLSAPAYLRRNALSATA